MFSSICMVGGVCYWLLPAMEGNWFCLYLNEHECLLFWKFAVWKHDGGIHKPVNSRSWKWFQFFYLPLINPLLFLISCWNGQSHSATHTHQRETHQPKPVYETEHPRLHEQVLWSEMAKTTFGKKIGPRAQCRPAVMLSTLWCISRITWHKDLTL